MTPFERCGLVVGILLALSLFCADATAYANLGRPPTSITQGYANGDYAIFDCPFGFRTGSEPACRFTLKEGRRRVTATFDPTEFGYNVMLQEYWLFGSLKDETISIAMMVDCVEADMRVFDDAPQQVRDALGDESDELRCQLFYDLKKGRLIARHVVVRFDKPDVPVTRSRILSQ